MRHEIPSREDSFLGGLRLIMIGSLIIGMRKISFRIYKSRGIVCSIYINLIGLFTDNSHIFENG